MSWDTVSGRCKFRGGDTKPDVEVTFRQLATRPEWGGEEGREKRRGGDRLVIRHEKTERQIERGREKERGGGGGEKGERGAPGKIKGGMGKHSSTES